MGRLKYFVAGAIMLLIIGVVDDNSLYDRFLRHQRMEDYRAQIDEYHKAYSYDSTCLNEMESNALIVEKLARERYYMHRPGEDVFVIREEPVAVETEEEKAISMEEAADTLSASAAAVSDSLTTDMPQ